MGITGEAFKLHMKQAAEKRAKIKRLAALPKKKRPSLAAIGRQFGISYQRVQQILKAD